MKKPKFKVKDLVILKYNNCLYTIGAFRLLKDNEFWYALHEYEYLVHEDQLILFKERKQMKEYKKLEALVEKILDVLDLGNSDGGYGPTIYGLEYLNEKQKEDQLQKISEILSDYYDNK